MKNSTLLNFLECLHIRDYNLLVEENGFKMDFSRANRSAELKSFIKNPNEKKSKLPSFLMLVLLFYLLTFYLLNSQHVI